MAYFAKLSEENIVLAIESVADADTTNSENVEDEATGIAFLQTVHGWTNWKKCSYNTRAGKYYNSDGTEADDQTKAYRKNYPGIGWSYNTQHDAFIPPKPTGFESWIISDETGFWIAPVDYPSITTYGDPAKEYYITWDENNLRWNATDIEDPQGSYRWDVATSTWITL